MTGKKIDQAEELSRLLARGKAYMDADPKKYPPVKRKPDRQRPKGWR